MLGGLQILLETLTVPPNLYILLWVGNNHKQTLDVWCVRLSGGLVSQN